MRPAPGPRPAGSTQEPAAQDTWHDRWLAWRDRCLASPRFRDWAAGFWPLRAVARRRAAGVFDLVAGFVYSQVLLACVRLKLFDLLAAGPLGLPVLAQRLDLNEAACLRLLRAAEALQLVQARSAGRWGLGAAGATLVGDRAISAMVEHHAALYADLADPLALLRGQRGPTQLGALWAYAGSAAPDHLARERVGDYSALMSASQPLVAGQVLDAVSLRGHRCLMDVGGGEGTFLRAVAERAPHLKLMLFDLPAVAERARERLAGAGLAERAAVHGGSFFHQGLPRGADVATLVRVVHDHDDDAALRILAAVFAALGPGGRLLLAEPLADTPGAAAMGNAYFGFYLLAMGSGRTRSATELGAMLKQVGFERVQVLPTRQPLQTGLISAWVPAAPGPG